MSKAKLGIKEVLARLKGVETTASGWSALCPAHDDSRPSLSVGEGSGGKLLLRCHAGCEFSAIMGALKFGSEPCPSTKSAGFGKQLKIVATYDYSDSAGDMSFQVVRFEPKDFRQRAPDPTKPDGWSWSMKGVTRVLYRLPQILQATQDGRLIYLVEGEKDVGTLVKYGFEATCNPGGAGKWLEQYTETLTGADVVIVPDRDKAGQDHGDLVARKLAGRAKSVRILELPTSAQRTVKDVTDWFEAGGKVEELQRLAEDAPLWSQPAQPVDANPCLPDSSLLDLEADAETSDMLTLFALGLERFQASRAGLKEIIGLIQLETHLFSHLDLNNHGGKTSLGKLLRRFEGRVLGGILLRIDSTDKRRPKVSFERVPERETVVAAAIADEVLFGKGANVPTSPVGNVGIVGFVGSCNPITTSGPPRLTSLLVSDVPCCSGVLEGDNPDNPDTKSSVPSAPPATTGPALVNHGGTLVTTKSEIATLIAELSTINSMIAVGTHRPGNDPREPFAAGSLLKGLMMQFLAFYGNHANYEGVMSLTQPKGLRLMLAALPVVTAGEFPPEADFMAQFLEKCLEPTSGANVTTAEIYDAHCVYFHARGATPLLETVFERTIPALLQAKFGVLKSHSLERDGKSRRGFCHLKLKASDQRGTPGTAGTPPEAEQSPVEGSNVVELPRARAMIGA